MSAALAFSGHLSSVLAMSWTLDYLRKGYSANRLCRGWKFLWLLVHRDRETNKHVLHNACLCNSKVQARMSKYLVPVGVWYFELWHSSPPTGAVSTSSARTWHGVLFRFTLLSKTHLSLTRFKRESPVRCLKIVLQFLGQRTCREFRWPVDVSDCSLDGKNSSRDRDVSSRMRSMRS